MNFFKVKTFAEAKKIILDVGAEIPLKTEILPLLSACGKRSAATVTAGEDVPEYNRSTVDGYAVKAENTYGASAAVPSLLKPIGDVKMGKVGQFEISVGKTVYVPTGGEVPCGANAVVMIEDTEKTEDGIAVYKPVRINENVITVGEDVKLDETVLTKGELITPLTVGVLSALGISRVEVFKPLKVAVISTGDELVGIDAKSQKGQIRDVNTQINVLLCKNAGFDVVSSELVADGFDRLDEAVCRACNNADIVLVSGGSSIGERDYTEKVFATRGKILIHGIALKPGKPTIAARCNNTLLFGLPGHPMACLLTLKLLVLDTLTEALGGKNEAPFVFADTTVNFPSSPGRLTVQPVELTYGEDGVSATPLFYKSGFVGVLARADGYILIPENAEGVYKGQRVKVYLL